MELDTRSLRGYSFLRRGPLSCVSRLQYIGHDGFEGCEKGAE
jgi:hypothetical protein